MTIPRFFISLYQEGQQEFVLDEETSRHVVRVLRMKQGDSLQLTDGKGHLLNAAIAGENKKGCIVRLGEATWVPAAASRITIGISLLKNSNRFEWFLEKATEIGVSRIVPLLCERTERQHFRKERMQSILVSALLQSQQVWIPEMEEPVSMSAAVSSLTADQKFIAHCAPGEKTSAASAVDRECSRIMLIGPEGDFTEEEINLALDHGYMPVALGNTRLRSETAGVVAATLLTIR